LIYVQKRRHRKTSVIEAWIFTGACLTNSVMCTCLPEGGYIIGAAAVAEMLAIKTLKNSENWVSSDMAARCPAARHVQRTVLA
jgi:hypothetical protein